MSATIDITVKRLFLPLVGVQGIDVLINGEAALQTDFGQTFTLELEPGVYDIAVRLRGVLNRTSNTIQVNVNEEEPTRLIAAYNRFWGSFRLRAV